MDWRAWGFTLGLTFLAAGVVQAQSIGDLQKEIEDLKERVKQIEEQEVEVVDEKGHRLHPVRGLHRATISGGFTAILQGSINNEGRFGGSRTEGSMSADLFLELPVHDQGSFLLRFDVVLGDGLAAVPPLFASPNGNTTGTNNDIEGFGNQPRLNFNEARYEHALFDQALRIVFGHIDLTSWFDENALANDERTDYLAQAFDNNPAIEWGGSENFFGPGLILVLSPTDMLDVSFGGFEGDGDYDKMFRQPFLIGQATLKARFGGREGSYRIYAWGRFTPHCNAASDATVFSSCDLVAGADQVRIKDRNTGLGLSFDQQLTDDLGVWARFGYQDPDVSQFDIAVTGGAVLSAGAIGRPNDALGLAYGAVFPSDAFKTATGRSDTEHYAEIYYRYAPFGDGLFRGLHLTPDFQIIANPGGDATVDPVTVWGLRTQVNF